MNLSDMTFGVEIETFAPAANFRRAGWSVGTYRHGATIPGFTGWRCKSDGSIDAPCDGTDWEEFEVVSPVLRGLDGLQQVTDMVDALKAMGARVNRSTGFHVHVGVANDTYAVDPEVLERLVFLTANVEDGLFATTGTPSRRHSSFCQSIQTDYATVQRPGRVRDLRTWGERKLPRGTSGHDCRYHTLNLMNIFEGQRPTVEFRVFAGTLNALKMRAYVQLCLGLVQLAAEWRKKSKWTAADRPYLLAGGPGERAVKRLLIVLGWSRNKSLFYGPHREHILSDGREGEFKQFGLLDPASLPAMKRLLVQLGRKYDGGPRRATDVSVDE